MFGTQISDGKLKVVGFAGLAESDNPIVQSRALGGAVHVHVL